MSFTNQYLGLTKEQKLRTTFEIGLTDVARLRSFDPKEGNLQTTLSILVKKLLHELNASTIQPGDFSTYQHAVDTCRIILGDVPETFTIGQHTYTRVVDGVQRGPTPDSTPRVKRPRSIKTDSRDDRRGAASVAQQAA